MLANTLDAQSMLLKVVKVLRELHFEIVHTGVQGLPFVKDANTKERSSLQPSTPLLK